MLKLNVGCGHTKMEGFINIDADASVNPDIVLDVTVALPYATGHVNEIRCFHTIEHIRGQYHPRVIQEFNRVLCCGGELFMAYPEARRCFEGWKANLHGQRDFFEATILGRGLTFFDRHQCLMDSQRFVPMLREFGFSVSEHEESEQPFNTLLLCKKVYSLQSREDLFKKELLCKT